jgi:hypothetical protein
MKLGAAARALELAALAPAPPSALAPLAAGVQAEYAAAEAAITKFLLAAAVAADPAAA